MGFAASDRPQLYHLRHQEMDEPYSRLLLKMGVAAMGRQRMLAVRRCSHSSGRSVVRLRAPGEGQQYLRHRPMERRAQGPVHDRLVAHTVSTSSDCDRQLTP